MKKFLLWFAGILADEIKRKLLDTNAKISVLNLQPGDRVLLRCKTHLSSFEEDHISQVMKELFPGHQIVILNDDAEIVIYHDEENKIIVKDD